MRRGGSGSFLYGDRYCSRSIVGTRGKGDVDTGTNHLVFRCVRDPPEAAPIPNPQNNSL